MLKPALDKKTNKEIKETTFGERKACCMSQLLITRRRLRLKGARRYRTQPRRE